MYKVVWSGYQPQLWRCGIISTPQVTLTSQIWGKLGRCNRIKVHPYFLETAYQWLEHFYMSNMNVWNGLRGISASNMTLWHHFHSTSHGSGRKNAKTLSTSYWGIYEWIWVLTLAIWSMWKIDEISTGPPNEDDWGKLKCVLKYHNSTKCLRLHLSAESLSILQWYVDSSHQTREHCKGHTYQLGG
jgi:hypothetical protein